MCTESLFGGWEVQVEWVGGWMGRILGGSNQSEIKMIQLSVSALPTPLYTPGLQTKMCRSPPIPPPATHTHTNTVIPWEVQVWFESVVIYSLCFRMALWYTHCVSGWPCDILIVFQDGLVIYQDGLVIYSLCFRMALWYTHCVSGWPCDILTVFQDGPVMYSLCFRMALWYTHCVSGWPCDILIVFQDGLVIYSLCFRMALWYTHCVSGWPTSSRRGCCCPRVSCWSSSSRTTPSRLCSRPTSSSWGWTCWETPTVWCATSPRAWETSSTSPSWWVGPRRLTQGASSV